MKDKKKIILIIGILIVLISCGIIVYFINSKLSLRLADNFLIKYKK